MRLSSLHEVAVLSKSIELLHKSLPCKNIQQPVSWRNGSALVSGTKGCAFESHRDRILFCQFLFLRSLRRFSVILSERTESRLKEYFLLLTCLPCLGSQSVRSSNGKIKRVRAFFTFVVCSAYIILPKN